MKRYLWIFIVAIALVAADQGTKLWAEANLASVRPSRSKAPHTITLEVDEDSLSSQARLGSGVDVGKQRIALANFIDAVLPMTSLEDATSLVNRGLVRVNGRIVSEPSKELIKGDQVVLLERQVEVIPDFFHLKYVENRGAAWGFLKDADDAWRRPFFIGVSLLAIVIILVLSYRVSIEQRMVLGALGCILAGALGNFIDRIRLNYVIDFIDWHYRDVYHWPTFNIADAAITVGVGLLFLDMALGGWRNRSMATFSHESNTEAEA